MNQATWSPERVWHLPWAGEQVPHALLDINRGCNITCEGCYNQGLPRNKTLAEVEAELELLLRKRRLQSVSIIGGEVTLHPQLLDIIRLVKRHGLDAELVSNGVLFDDAMLAGMKKAGADLVVAHIDATQKRPDLPPDFTPADLRALRERILERIARHGLDPGLAVTTFPDRLPELSEAIRFYLDSPHPHYLLVTLFRNVSQIHEVKGAVNAGMSGIRHPSGPGIREDTLTNQDMAKLMWQEFGLPPFACKGSNRDPLDLRWLTYLCGTVHSGTGERVVLHGLRGTAFERLYVHGRRWLKGGYPMYQPAHAGRFAVQLVLNGLAGGSLAGNLRLLLASLRRGHRLHAKRLLFQCPANVLETGQVVHCDNCPDAVIKNGRLVPVCISDRVCD